MHGSSSSSFPSHSFPLLVADLYRAPSFQSPPAAATVPTAPEDWLYYEPGEEPTALSFPAFMETQAFGQARRQMERRIAELQAFAQAHFAPRDFTHIEAGFAEFLRHLGEGDGGFFSRDQWQLLFSFGKRCLDDVCLLLHHPAIPLHTRKTVVRELADQVRRCRGSGPAFVVALNSLQQPEGTLRGIYGQALVGLFDQTVLRFVSLMHRDRDEDWRESMEVHIVNRFRLELGLPGADHRDRSSLLAVVSPEQVRDCAQWLLRDGRPAAVAIVLAAQYRSRLTELARQEIQPDGRPAPGDDGEGTGEGARVDPGQEAHLAALMRAFERLRPTFAGVTLNSLVHEDVATGQFQWRSGDALVVRELLLELSAQGLIQPPTEQVAVRGGSADGAWELRHIDERVPFVREYLAGSGPGGVLSCVRLVHLQSLMAPTAHVSETLREAVVDGVLRGEPATALEALSPGWLSNEVQAEALLKHLGPARSAQWLGAMPLHDGVLRHLMSAGIAQGHGDLLQHLIHRISGRAPTDMLTLAGANFLSRACAAGLPDVVRTWAAALVLQASMSLSDGQLEEALEGTQRRAVVPMLLARNSAQMLDTVLGLIIDLTEAGRLPRKALLRQLSIPGQEVMAAGCQAALRILGRRMLDMARLGWLESVQLRKILEGDWPGNGCRGAMAGGHAGIAAWFHETVLTLAAEGHLQARDAGRLLAGQNLAFTHESVARMAVRLNQADMLAAHLDAVLHAVGRGWVSTAQLHEVLSLPGMTEPAPLGHMMREPTGALAAVWVERLITAHQRGLLDSDQVMGLLAPGEDDDRDASPGATHGRWREVLDRLAREGVLAPAQVQTLLDAPPP